MTAVRIDSLVRVRGLPSRARTVQLAACRSAAPGTLLSQGWRCKAYNTCKRLCGRMVPRVRTCKQTCRSARALAPDPGP